MALLLLMARKSTYDINDIVCAYDDDYPLHENAGICLPIFLVVKVPGPKKDFIQYLEVEFFTEYNILTGITKTTDVKNKRIYKIDFLAALGQEKINEIAASDWLIETVSINSIEAK